MENRAATARRRRQRWATPLGGVVASVAAVCVVTGAIALVKAYVPVLSLGVLYVFAVLPIAVFWGLVYALPVSIASMLAFNWWFLPPVHTFTLSDSRNWFALAVYVVTAVVVSELAARARRRAADAEQRERESALLAELSTRLLQGSELEDELGEIGERAAEILGVDGVQIQLGREKAPPPHEAPYSLTAAGTEVGTLYASEDSAGNLAVRQRFLPALAALLAVATQRDRLAAEALEAETLRRSDAVKTAVLRAVSHDLRTPLTGIGTAVGALRNPTLTLTERDRADLLETIELDYQRLTGIVGNLLDLSRLQAGAAIPEPELWTVDELVRQAVEDLGATDSVHISTTVAPLVNVDAAQIERVLSNLIENALKFSPPDAPVEIRINTTRKEVIVRVIDQGPGLPDDELERVFEPFYRAHRGAGGAGLGLAIARGFAEANGGRLWVESRPGQGASFALAFPVVEEAVEIGA